MKKKSQKIFILLGVAAFGLSALLFIAPVIMTLAESFRFEGMFSLERYKRLLFNCFDFYPVFWNSVLYGVSITLLQLVIAIPCGFGFCTANFRGKRVLFVCYIILMMMPLQVTTLPNYLGLRDMGLINTRAGIILPMIFSPFGVVIMHQYMTSLNTGIVEAARLETSSVIRIILSIIVPQIKVCILAVAVFVFAEAWNMLEQPMLFLKEIKLQNLTVLISKAEQYEEGVMQAASVLFIVPVYFVYRFFHESLEKGLYFGNLKH